MTIDEIRTKELEKLAQVVNALVKRRPNTHRPIVFQVKDAMNAGLISKFEAREMLTFMGEPNQFPCFKD